MKRTCLDCKYYVGSKEPERNRMDSDFCLKRGVRLPVAAFCFDDLCCSTGGDYFSVRALKCLEDIAGGCIYYKKRHD